MIIQALFFENIYIYIYTQILGISLYKKVDHNIDQTRSCQNASMCSGITSSLMVNQPMPRVIRSAPNACQFHPRAYYTQMAKNATTKDAQPV